MDIVHGIIAHGIGVISMKDIEYTKKKFETYFVAMEKF